MSKVIFLKKVIVLNLKSDVGDVKVLPMLFWTLYYTGESNNGIIWEQNSAMAGDCPSLADRCRLTNNRSLIEESLVVIFHMHDFDVDDLPKFRSPEQRWVFFNMESPLHTRKDAILKNLPQKYQFNWTLTYRLESAYLIVFRPLIISLVIMI